MPDPVTHADDDLNRLAEEIFDSLAKQFPVCMASDEFHYFPQIQADDLDWSGWDNFTPQAMAQVIERLKRWENRIQRHLSASLPQAQTLDADMLQRVVRTLREQFHLCRVYETQPTFYLTILGIGLADAIEAGECAFEARLKNLPEFLNQARRNLQRIPLLFRDLGLDMLAKQQAWLASLSLPGTSLMPIHKAMHSLGAHLKQVSAVPDCLPSVALYERIAQYHMGCQSGPQEIADELEQEIAETRSILDQSAASLAPGHRWQAVIEDLPRPKLASGGIEEVYHSTILELAHHCADQGLVAAGLLRQCPVTVAPIPNYMRPVRSNAAFSMPPAHPPRGGTFYILGTAEKRPLPADYRLLAAHETFPGHHLLDTCRWGHSRLVRRHIEFPLFYEGWASFAEELMFETGFFGDAVDRILMAKRRFWRALRGKIDFDIHTRRQTIDQAAACLASEGMPRDRSRAMVRRYCLKPGYQLSYSIGRRRFRALYDAFRPAQRTGQKNPAEFARRVLAQGEIGFKNLEQILQ